MTTMTLAMKINENKVIVNNPWSTEHKELPYINTLEEIEQSDLFDEFQEQIRDWKRARNYMDLGTCASHFRTIARQNGYNLAPEAASMFIDIYWELV